MGNKTVRRRKGHIHCDYCELNYPCRWLGSFKPNDLKLTPLKNVEVKKSTLKFINHVNAQVLESGNCHSIIDISKPDRINGNYSDHDCDMLHQYTDLIIVNCNIDCENCKGTKGWYTEREGNTCCDNCHERHLDLYCDSIPVPA